MVREIKNKYFIGQQMFIIDDDGCGYLDYIVLIELLPSGELLYNTRQGAVFTEENRKKHSSLGRKGSKNGRSKLKDEDVLKIRSLHKNGVQNTEIYKLYPQVSKVTIRDIINNKTWTHLL